MKLSYLLNYLKGVVVIRDITTMFCQRYDPDKPLNGDYDVLHVHAHSGRTVYLLVDVMRA